MLSLDRGEISSMIYEVIKKDKKKRNQNMCNSSQITKRRWSYVQHTFAANKKFRSHSQSLSISSCNSFRISGSRTDERAATRCSLRIRSTVAWYPCSSAGAGSLSGIKLNKGTSVGVIGGDCEWSLLEWYPLVPNKPIETGVAKPEDPTGFVRDFNASDAARSNRFVVPNAFVDPERAEHTMATLWLST